MPLKKVLDFHEGVTHSRLRELCERYGADVYPKVRLADVLPIEGSGISPELYRFALQAHFDFLVVDEQHEPLFAVEFDGESHQTSTQRKRDEQKNALCERFTLPLLRVRGVYLFRTFRNMDLLTWFVEVWFLQAAFDQAQAAGNIPWDEPFDPCSFVSAPDRKERFPYWLDLDVRMQIQRLHRQGRCRDPVPSEIIGRDDAGNGRAIAYLLIDKDHAVCVETAMHAQRFPVTFTDILSPIVIHELYAELMAVLEKKAKPQSCSAVDQRLADFQRRYQMLSSSGYVR